MAAVGESSRPHAKEQGVGKGVEKGVRLGRYELITQIGQGGMAEVQLALQRGAAGFEKLVVIKLVHQHLASEKAFVDMLLDEARVAALVKHPNVVDIYDLGEANGRYFIAMEYLEGEPLLAVLRAGREGKRLDPLSTARLIADTAEGLDAAHELKSMGGDPIGLVHHDVSLGNIVVLYNGQVKLVDFGVAKATQTAGPSTKIHGKFSYMAPEKLRGAVGDRRSDIWSLGCVLWEALTLRRLFKGANEAETMKQVLEMPIPRPSTVNGDVLREFDLIVMHALERNPYRRYMTAKALATDLEEILRKQGYSGRNDVIAKHMQSTFGEHIEARKKLLQEVSSKGRASADILEAAFADPAIPSVRASEDFSVKFNRGPALAAAMIAAPRAYPRASIDDGLDLLNTATAIDVPFAPDEDAISDVDPLDNGATILDPNVVPQYEEAPPRRPMPRPVPRASRPPPMPFAPFAPFAAPSAAVTAPVPIPDEPAPDAASEAASSVASNVVATTPEAGRAPVPRRTWFAVAGLAAAGALFLIALARRGTSDDGPADAPAQMLTASSPISDHPTAAPARIEPQPTAATSPTNPDAATSDREPKPSSKLATSSDTKPDATSARAAAAKSDVARQGATSALAKAAAKPETKPLKSPDDPKSVATSEPKPSDPKAGEARDKGASKVAAEAHYKAGLQAWVRGDTRAALSAYRKAQQANPGYAPTWRGLGMAYEKSGDRLAAKMAFQRYLNLSSTAPDAASIRARLQRL